MSIDSATVGIYYGILINDIPESALPYRSRVPSDVKLRLRFVPSSETPLQYEENLEAPDYEEVLSVDDFDDPADFYEAVLQNLSAIYELPITKIQLVIESAEFEGRWILGVALDSFGDAQKAGVCVAHPFSRSRYDQLVERARPVELLLQQWAAVLETGPPQIILTLET